mgnify:CR=1 FL=1
MKKPEPEDSHRTETALPSYVSETRRIGVSIILILPLLVLYQIGVVQAGSTTRNIAEVWMTGPFGVLGWPATTAVNVAALLALVYGLWESQRRGSLSIRFMGVMLAESMLYALLMYTGISAATAVIHDATHHFLAVNDVSQQQLLLSLGAAVYEEILFRFLLIGGGVLLLRKLFMWEATTSAVLLLVVSSILFSGAHHVGSGAESFDTFTFLFRALCGLTLGAVYLARGLGIAVWTHAIYNMLVLLRG